MTQARGGEICTDNSHRKASFVPHAVLQPMPAVI
jgi:hypothetical protein